MDDRELRILRAVDRLPVPILLKTIIATVWCNLLDGRDWVVSAVHRTFTALGIMAAGVVGCMVAAFVVLGIIGLLLIGVRAIF